VAKALMLLFHRLNRDGVRPGRRRQILCSPRTAAIAPRPAAFFVAWRPRGDLHHAIRAWPADPSVTRRPCRDPANYLRAPDIAWAAFHHTQEHLVKGVVAETEPCLIRGP